jgi:hypothetical protein
MDGRLAIDLTGPDPIDASRDTKIGFEANRSHIQGREIKVRAAGVGAG